MEILELVVTFFTEGFMGDLLGWLGGLLVFWGFADLYMFYRFSRGEGVDKTAALWHTSFASISFSWLIKIFARQKLPHLRFIMEMVQRSLFLSLSGKKILL